MPTTTTTRHTTTDHQPGRKPWQCRVCGLILWLDAETYLRSYAGEERCLSCRGPTTADGYGMAMRYGGRD